MEMPEVIWHRGHGLVTEESGEPPLEVQWETRSRKTGQMAPVLCSSPHLLYPVFDVTLGVHTVGLASLHSLCLQPVSLTAQKENQVVAALPRSSSATHKKLGRGLQVLGVS